MVHVPPSITLPVLDSFDNLNVYKGKNWYLVYFFKEVYCCFLGNKSPSSFFILKINLHVCMYRNKSVCIHTQIYTFNTHVYPKIYIHTDIERYILSIISIYIDRDIYILSMLSIYLFRYIYPMIYISHLWSSRWRYHSHIYHKKYYAFDVLLKMLILIYWKKYNMLICVF